MIRTFHKPVKMTIDVSEEKVELQTKIWSGSGGYEWGEVEVEKKRVLTPKEVTSLKALLRPLDLKELKKAEDYRGLDGSAWVLSFSNEKKDTVNLWTPGASTKKRKLEEFVAFGNFMWKLSGVSGDQY